MRPTQHPRQPVLHRPSLGAPRHRSSSDGVARHLRELHDAVARLREMRTDAALTLVVGSRWAGLNANAFSDEGLEARAGVEPT